MEPAPATGVCTYGERGYLRRRHQGSRGRLYRRQRPAGVDRSAKLLYNIFDAKSCVDRISQSINAKASAQKQAEGHTRDFNRDPRTQTADRLSQGVFYGTSPSFKISKAPSTRSRTLLSKRSNSGGVCTCWASTCLPTHGYQSSTIAGSLVRADPGALPDPDARQRGARNFQGWKRCVWGCNPLIAYLTRNCGAECWPRCSGRRRRSEAPQPQARLCGRIFPPRGRNSVLQESWGSSAGPSLLWARVHSD